MTPEQLRTVLEQHKMWFESDGEVGERANLRGANLRDANLRDTDLTDVDLKDADLRGADLRGAYLKEANLIGANLERAKLTYANLTGADLTGADLKRANLKRANLKRANLIDANLRGTDLRGTDLRGANLRGANLTDANLERADLKDANLELANLTDANLELADLELANLKRANLRDANLELAILTDADLEGTNLELANLERANLVDAFLVDSNLTGANLTGAFLERANLRDANLEGADLTSADLRIVNLENANLTDATLENAILTDADITGTILEAPIEPRRAFGRARQAHREVSQMSAPMKVAAFKRAFPAAFELIKHDIRAGTLDPDSARALIDQFGMTWDVDKVTWRSALQRLSPVPNDVLRFNVDLGVVTDDPELLKTIEAIRQTSYQSQHPVRKGGAFTVGWVRYSVFEDAGVLLVEEIQSDLPIVRKGLSDEEFKRQLKAKGMTDTQIRAALDVLEPYAQRFYTDALSLVFDIAHEAGLTVEMLSYTQKQAMVEPGERTSPRSVYEKLPKMMGMKKGESQLDFVEGRVWRVKPNPPGQRKALRVPKRFRWSQP